tara:strand:+ start:16 stop:615 length:600 start_codon:yes stop_codon:yes gene_type:complete
MNILTLLMSVTLVGAMGIIYFVLNETVLWPIKVLLIEQREGVFYRTKDRAKKIRSAGGGIVYRLKRLKISKENIPNKSFIINKKGKQTVLLYSPEPGNVVPFGLQVTEPGITFKTLPVDDRRATIRAIEARTRKFAETKGLMAQIIPIVAPVVTGLAIGLVFYLTADSLNAALELMGRLIDQNTLILDRINELMGKPPG